MDALTAELLLAVATGASEAAGGKALERLNSLVHRWFKRGVSTDAHRTSEADDSNAAKNDDDTIIDDLERLQRDKDEHAAARLATSLTSKAETDASFRGELEAWLGAIRPVNSTTITGGKQDVVMTVGRIDNFTLTYGAPGQPQESEKFALTDPTRKPPPPGVLIQIHEAVLRRPSQRPRSLGGLRPRVEGFAARRDDLEVLQSLLTPQANRDGNAIVEVVGGPGVGKTALALEAAHAAKAEGWFPDGILFLDLHGYDDASRRPEEAIGEALSALGVEPEHIPVNLDEAGALYRSQLDELTMPVLVVVDNASSVDQVLPLRPGVTRHKLLITSRESMPHLGARVHRLMPLDERDSVELLNSALRVRDPLDTRIANYPDDAAALARSCGYLPLALAVAAASLARRPGLKTGELASQLRDYSTRLDRLDELSRADKGKQGVRAAFGFSCELLDPEHQRIFRLCAASPGPDLATDSVVALAGGEGHSVIAALDELASAHLIMPDADRGRWHIHDLLREYASELSESQADADGREAAYDRLLGLYLEDATRAELTLGSVDQVTAQDTNASWHSVVQWFEAERLNLMAAVNLAAATARTGVTIGLAFRLMNIATVQQHFDDAETLVAVGLGEARKNGDATFDFAAVLMCAAQVKQLTHRTVDAIADFRAAISILENLLASGESDNVEEIAELLRLATASLGGALLDMGRTEEAIALLQAAASAAPTTRSRIVTVQTLVRLGSALERKQRYGEAVAVQRQAVAAADEVGSALYRGIALAGLGGSLSNVKQQDEAVTITRQAADLLGETGLVFLQSEVTNALGDVLWKAGKKRESLAAHRQAVELVRQTGNQSAEGASLTRLGDELRDASRRKDAVATYGAAIELFASSGDRRGEARAQQRLGWTLHGLKRYAAALAAFERATALSGAVGEHDSEAHGLNGQGVALRDLGRLEAAVTAHQRAADLYRGLNDSSGRVNAIKRLGEDLAKFRSLDLARLMSADSGSRESGVALLNIADALLSLGRAGQSISVAEHAAEVSRETGDLAGECRALNLAGRSLGSLKRFDEAVAMQRQCLTLARQTGDPQTAALALGNLGNLCNLQGLFDEAESTWREAVEIFAGLQDRGDLGWSLDGLGDALYGLKEFEGAAAAYQRAIDSLQSTSDRRLEAAATWGLASIWEQQGHYGRARQLLGRAAELAEKSGDYRFYGAMLTLRGVAMIKHAWHRFRGQRPAVIPGDELCAPTGISQVDG